MSVSATEDLPFRSIQTISWALSSSRRSTIRVSREKSSPSARTGVPPLSGSEASSSRRGAVWGASCAVCRDRVRVPYGATVKAGPYHKRRARSPADGADHVFFERLWFTAGFFGSNAAILFKEGMGSRMRSGARLRLPVSMETGNVARESRSTSVREADLSGRTTPVLSYRAAYARPLHGPGSG